MLILSLDFRGWESIHLVRYWSLFFNSKIWTQKTRKWSSGHSWNLIFRIPIPYISSYYDGFTLCHFHMEFVPFVNIFWFYEEGHERTLRNTLGLIFNKYYALFQLLKSWPTRNVFWVKTFGSRFWVIWKCQSVNPS